jgi:transcriptional regulator with XRE-family HTH domain
MAETTGPRRADNADADIGRLVRAHRLARGLSQTDLANHIGVTFQQVQKYESGANRISMGRLTRIAKVLGLSVTYLLSASRASPPTPNYKEDSKLSEAIDMLGRMGALRLLRAFHALPTKPARLRESIVAMVESTASAARPQSGSRSTKPPEE